MVSGEERECGRVVREGREEGVVCVDNLSPLEVPRWQCKKLPGLLGSRLQVDTAIMTAQKCVNGEANTFKMELFNDIHEGSAGC